MASYSALEETSLTGPENVGHGIPRIDLNLWDHKRSIAIHWTILLISSGILPVVLYFVLRYAAHLALGTGKSAEESFLGVTTAIFGVVTAFSLIQRTWLLLKSNSTCRPIGGTRGQLDYFHWNFMFGFVGTTIIIVVGNLTKNIRIVTLGIPVLLVEVCFQVLLIGVLRASGARAPIRMSSVAKGDKVRSAVYAIAEDIVAVDGGQGQHYRRQLQSRYLASGIIQRLCLQLDLLWGVSGLLVGAACLALIFILENANVAYIIGWVVPWIYAGIMTIITISMTSAALKKEDRLDMRLHKATQAAGYE